jgi:Ion channel.
MNMVNAPNLEKYADSLIWAVSTMTGCSFGDVTPRTLNEIILSLLTFLIGMIVLAKTFSDFASLKFLLDEEKTQKK